MSLSPFWTLHRDLPREGPGAPEDVAWALSVAGLPAEARIADVACGPGADIAAMLDVAPRAHVTAIDKTAHFVADVERVFENDPRVDVRQADMREIGGPFDFIWCAGAAYIVGVEAALQAWRGALAPGGMVAFSEPCLFEGACTEAAAFWDGYDVLDAGGIADRVQAAGYDMVDSRVVGDAAWENYYTPMTARIEMLRKGADAALSAVLDDAQVEVDGWRRLRRETGYLLSVVRPL